MSSPPIRSTHFLLAAAIGCLLFWSAALDAQDKKDTRERIQKKTYDFKDAGKEMEYALFVPSKYDKEKKTPLLVALHGLGSNPQQIMRYPALTDQAEKHGYVVVAPMGYNTGGWYGATPPGFFKLKPENLPELSEKDVRNVLEIARKDFNIDENRIYLMGHSMGGGGTIHLALKYPDIWAALGPIAPAIFGHKEEEAAKIKHIPVIMIQGDKDFLVPVAGPRRWAEAMKKAGMTLEYMEIACGGHLDVATKNIPAVFEFFNKHQKKAKTK